MKILAVGISLSTLSMSYALRTAGFSVQLVERLSQMNFNRKLNAIAPQSWKPGHRRNPFNLSQNAASGINRNIGVTTAGNGLCLNFLDTYE